MKSIAKLFSIFLLFSFTAAALSQPQNDDFLAVQQSVEMYFDGTSRGTPTLLNDVFAKGMMLQFIRDGKLMTWTAEEYVSGFKEGVEYERIGRIVSMDITQTAAMVKAEIEMNDRIYVDYLLLLKEQGKWKITNKIFAQR